MIHDICYDYGGDIDERLSNVIDPLIPECFIKDAVKTLSYTIMDVFEEKDIIILSILTGSWVFVSDLIREMPLGIRIEPVIISSYPDKAIRSQECKFRFYPNVNSSNRNVLIVDDIYDSGKTMDLLLDFVYENNPAMVKTCVLLKKERPDLPKRKDNINFVGFDIRDEFVVGYGLDYNGLYRNLPYIGILPKGA